MTERESLLGGLGLGRQGWRDGRVAIPVEANSTLTLLSNPFSSGHVFFVDTQANPPRSIWTHPLDDPEYVSTLPLDQQPQWAAAKTKKDDPYTPTGAAGPHGEHNPHPVQGTSTQRQSHPSQPQHQQGEDKRTFGRKLKDKLTNSSHEDRVRERAAQAKAERERYEQYIKRRKALQDAVNSGQYQPRFSAPSGAYTYGGGYGGMGYGGGYGGLGGGMGSRYGGGYDIYGSSYDRYGYPNRRYAPGGMYGMGGSRAGMGQSHMIVVPTLHQLTKYLTPCRHWNGVGWWVARWTAHRRFDVLSLRWADPALHVHTQFAPSLQAMQYHAVSPKASRRPCSVPGR